MADDVPRWPAAQLGKVLAQGYSRAWADAVQSTAMEKGLPKTRLRTAATFEPLKCALMVDIPRLQRLKRFYNEETVFGSLPFWMPDQVLNDRPIGTAGGAPLTTAGGSPLLISAHWLVMFEPGSPPQEGDNQAEWFRVSFSLLILP